MEKRIFRIEIALLIILVVVITNLVLLLIQPNNDTNVTAVEKTNMLPAKFDESFQADLLLKIKILYNEQNYHELYMLFSKYARMQFTESKMKDNFSDLITFTGEIIDYAYADHEFLGEEANAKYYQVVYKAKFTKGMGRLTINIREFKSEIELMGVHINLEKLE